MRRQEREQILRQGVTTAETPRARRELAALQEDVSSGGLRGRRLRLRLRNFRPAADGYLTALGGPLPYMVRLRTITELVDAHVAHLETSWRALAVQTEDDDAFADAWRETVGASSFYEVNELIDRHNRFYPVEARLPMDPRKRDYALVGGHDYRRRPLSPAWALERFPPSRERALAG